MMPFYMTGLPSIVNATNLLPLRLQHVWRWDVVERGRRAKAAPNGLHASQCQHCVSCTPRKPAGLRPSAAAPNSVGMLEANTCQRGRWVWSWLQLVWQQLQMVVCSTGCKRPLSHAVPFHPTGLMLNMSCHAYFEESNSSVAIVSNGRGERRADGDAPACRVAQLCTLPW